MLLKGEAMPAGMTLHLRQNNFCGSDPGAVRLVVCDLDSALLNSRKLISQANLKAIKAVRSRGIFVTVCTGRIPRMMEVYSRIMEIRGCFVAANGAIVVDTRNGGMPYAEYLNPKDAGRFLEFCRQEGFDHVAAAVEGCYYVRGSERIKKFEQYNETARMEGLRQIQLRQFDSAYDAVKNMRIYKILVSGLSEDQMRKAEEFIRGLSFSYCTSSEPGLLDISAFGVDKGKGVQILAGIMGYEKEEICVIGDCRSDLPMFDAAGFSIAMGSADDEIKSRASVVTGANDEDGVAMALEKFFLGS